jgi:hypothetical protein
VRVGMEATEYARWFERLLAELKFELGRRGRTDSGHANTQAEDRARISFRDIPMQPKSCGPLLWSRCLPEVHRFSTLVVLQFLRFCPVEAHLCEPEQCASFGSTDTESSMRSGAEAWAWYIKHGTSS